MGNPEVQLRPLSARQALRDRNVRRFTEIGLVVRCVITSLASFLAAGCTHVRGIHELTPLGRAQPVVEKKDAFAQLFREGEQPDREGVRIAKVTVEGNSYANRAALEKALLAEAKKVAADYVVVTHQETIQDQVIMHPRTGLLSVAISAAQGTGDMSVISRPVLHGIACRWATASLGVVVDEQGNVKYVKQASPAERAGLVEGMRIVAINGKVIETSQFVYETEVLSKQAGEMVVVEALAVDQSKRRVAIVLEGVSGQPAVRQASFVAPMAESSSSRLLPAVH